VMAGYPYFFAVILANRHAVVIGQLTYSVALGVVVVAAVSAHLSGRTRRTRDQLDTPARLPGDRLHLTLQ
jgi:hypothetical protein